MTPPEERSERGNPKEGEPVRGRLAEKKFQGESEGVGKDIGLRGPYLLMSWWGLVLDDGTLASRDTGDT